MSSSNLMRRDFLRSLSGLTSIGALSPLRAISSEPSHATSGNLRHDLASQPIMLPNYARVQNYQSLKQSSYDTAGANHDATFIDVGATSEIFFAEGPGIITHIWSTMAPLSTSRDVLKQIVLRMYWEGNAKPSVEVPIGDFFGLNLSEYFNYQSAFLNCSPEKGLNCYFAMPFRRSARITITNESDRAVRLFFFNIDYQLMRSLPDDVMYFHAQYRQTRPNKAMSLPNGVNKDGKYNYVFLETRGRGHLMGVTLGVLRTADGWWGEGDDMTFIDNEDGPAIYGTGAEDYFNGGWGFGPTPFANLYNGQPYSVSTGRAGSHSCVYRWHADNPVTFSKYLKHTLEHGSANDRADCYYSVAYWYQTEPYTDFPALPPVAERSTSPILT